MSIGDPFSVAALFPTAPPVDRRSGSTNLFEGEHDSRELELMRRYKAAREASDN